MKNICCGILFICLFIAGCSEGSGSSTRVRIVNASPDAPPLDFLVNGELLEENIGYTEASGYLEVDSGRLDIQVNRTLSSNSLVRVSSIFEDGTDYTIVVSDVVDKIQLVIYQDDNSAPDAGQVRIRVINAAPSAPRVDMYLTTQGDDISDRDPSTKDLRFTEGTRYFDRDENRYQVRITTIDTKAVLLDTGGIRLVDGDIRTIIIFDVDGGGRPLLSATLADSDN